MPEGEPRFESRELSPEKQELFELEKTGQYVFHGSGESLDELEPRQAIDSKKGPDGEPAIFTTEMVDFAIFAAIVNKKNAPKNYHVHQGVASIDGVFHLELATNKETLDQINDEASGYVYVFEKKDFSPYRKKTEHVRHKAIKPFKKIKVSKRDLPENIQLFEE